MIRAWLGVAAFVVLAAGGARAQDVVPLANGWTSHDVHLVNAPEGIACAGGRAFIRNWFGDVVMWDGVRWSALPRPAQAQYGRSLAASPDGHVFLESGNDLAEWDGARWVPHALVRWEGDLDGQLAAPSSAEVYYVGRGRITRREPIGFRTYGGGTWRTLSAVAVPGREVWVGGQGGTVLRHDGRSWSRLATGTDRWIRRLLAFTPNDVWALGDGETYGRSTILHWNGTAWEHREQGLPVGHPITALGGTAEAVYATGEFGLIRWSGTAWAMEIDDASLGTGYHQLDEVCATDRHVIVVDRAGRAVMHAR